MKGKLFGKPQNGKNPTKREKIYGIGKGLDRIEKKKEKNNRERDYGRLRSANEYERSAKREKRKKKVKLKR